MPRTKKRGVPTLGERIKQLMESLQLEASELSARTGISESYLSRIIRGEVPNPTIDFVIRIATGLGVTETQLLMPESRRRSSGVLAAPLGSDHQLESGSVADLTLGQKIDAALEEEGLSTGERERIATILIPHIKELAELVKLARGESNAAQ
jgi:transcriptional regulator with XRE-family HTH domain